MLFSVPWCNRGHHLLYGSYLLTPKCRVLLEKLTGLQLVKKFPAFHGTRRVITVLISVRHLSLSWARPIQSTYPHPTSWRFILILSTHLRLGLPSGLFPSGFSTKILYTTLSLPIRATCPAHLILLDFIARTILGEEYWSFRSSLCNLPHYPIMVYSFCIYSLSCIITARWWSNLGPETSHRIKNIFMKVSWLWLEILLNLIDWYASEDVPCKVFSRTARRRPVWWRDYNVFCWNVKHKSSWSVWDTSQIICCSSRCKSQK